MKLGSVFDGSGTAPLTAAMCGIEPVWASEIKPFPIEVTSKRFPRMKHLGSVLDINGAEVEPVDIICGGSPCQDLSVAGKQKGLHEGERSHLFFEMTRIIREMRGATNGKYPRYVIFENVCGAFGSNNGNDFLAILQAFAEIADPDVHVPRPPCKGKTDRLDWKYSGSIVGDGWSIAYRTVDAQYWGVPHRRRRLYLVADLASERAGEILFEPKSVSGDSEPCGTSRQGTAEDAEGCSGGSGGTLSLSKEQQSAVSRGTLSEGVCTIRTGTRAVREMVAVYDTTQITSLGNYSNPKPGDPCHPLAAQQHPPLAVCVGNGQLHNISMAEQMNTLDCMHDQQAVLTDGKPPRRYIVRRLTPLECCRLQGFPDWWIDGCSEERPVDIEFVRTGALDYIDPNGKIEGSDSAQYKLWGNGMALPNMLHVMRGIANQENEQ